MSTGTSSNTAFLQRIWTVDLVDGGKEFIYAAIALRIGTSNLRFLDPDFNLVREFDLQKVFGYG
jgi:hypothetical protein